MLSWERTYSEYTAQATPIVDDEIESNGSIPCSKYRHCVFGGCSAARCSLTEQASLKVHVKGQSEMTRTKGQFAIF